MIASTKKTLKLTPFVVDARYTALDEYIVTQTTQNRFKFFISDRNPSLHG